MLELYKISGLSDEDASLVSYVLPTRYDDTGKSVLVSSTAVDGGDGSKILYYINYARLYLNVCSKNEYVAVSIGYLIIYIILIVFTAMFTIRYMKRVIYVAFLTLMAPLVAMTYPLDKIRDRKSTSI